MLNKAKIELPVKISPPWEFQSFPLPGVYQHAGTGEGYFRNLMFSMILNEGSFELILFSH